MPKPMPNMENRKHGIAGYNYGCRCEICSEAKAVKRKEYQSSKAWEYQRTYRERVKLTNPEQFAKMKEQNSRYKKQAHERDPEKSRWDTIYKKYKITKAMYEGLLESQGGVCAICQGLPNKYFLSVDHDHSCCPGIKTCGNCIRGLLCGSCNSFLGRVNDDPSSAIRYLEKYPKKR